MKKRMREIPHVFKLIGVRAATLALRLGHEIEPLQIMASVMDVDRVIPLRLQELLEADDGNFAHDVFGIMRHWDTIEHKMRDCFLPRYARLQSEEDAA